LDRKVPALFPNSLMPADRAVRVVGRATIYARTATSMPAPLSLDNFFEWESDLWYPNEMNCLPNGGGTTSDNRRPCSAVCSEKQGAWDATYAICYVRSRTKGLCAKVTSSGSGYNLDATGGAGCLYADKDSFAIIQRIQKTGSYAVTFDDVDTTVRSAYDPFVVASRMTSGSYNFGLTRAQKILYGTVLMGVGGSIMAIMGLVTVFLFKAVFGRRDGYSNAERQPLGYPQQSGYPAGGQPYGNQQFAPQQPPPAYQQPAYQQGGYAPPPPPQYQMPAYGNQGPYAPPPQQQGYKPY